jgi:hypothetical protein
LAAAKSARGYATFVSAPHLSPPTLTVLTRSNPSPGLLFVASLNGPGQRGPTIVDDHGRLVWFKAVDPVAIDFRVQQYRGKPVLTWWEGVISAGGVGQGEGVIVDQTYKEIARVRAGNGLQADVHELLLTPSGTALITAYASVNVDLSAVGGPSAHPTLDSVVQEVDVATGAVLFEWHSLDHVPVKDSYAPILDPFDYFHVNSIDIDIDAQTPRLGATRRRSAKLERKTGEIMWRLGGAAATSRWARRLLHVPAHDARDMPTGR